MRIFGFITEHLFPIDFDSAVITRPKLNESTGKNPGLFEDEITIQTFGVARQYLQSFTVSGGMIGLPGFANIPVYVVGFGGEYGILNITKTSTYVEINGNRGNPIKCDK